MTVNVGGQSNADARLRDKFRPRHVRARSQRGRSGTGKTIGEPQLDIWHPPQYSRPFDRARRRPDGVRRHPDNLWSPTDVSIRA